MLPAFNFRLWSALHVTYCSVLEVDSSASLLPCSQVADPQWSPQEWLNGALASLWPHISGAGRLADVVCCCRVVCGALPHCSSALQQGASALSSSCLLALLQSWPFAVARQAAAGGRLEAQLNSTAVWRPRFLVGAYVQACVSSAVRNLPLKHRCTPAGLLNLGLVKAPAWPPPSLESFAAGQVAQVASLSLSVCTTPSL